jgi:hypothetical protein
MTGASTPHTNFRFVLFMMLHLITINFFIYATTGSGKSKILLTIGSLQTGVILLMVALIGLGSDQVAK